MLSDINQMEKFPQTILKLNSLNLTTELRSLAASFYVIRCSLLFKLYCVALLCECETGVTQSLVTPSRTLDKFNRVSLYKIKERWNSSHLQRDFVKKELQQNLYNIYNRYFMFCRFQIFVFLKVE